MSLLGFFSSPWVPISCQQHRITMPKLMALNSIVTELLSDDSDDERERVSEGWFHEMESSRAYKDAVQVFSSRKFCRHQDKKLDNPALQTILASFLNEPAIDHFSGVRKKKINTLQGKFTVTHSDVASTRSKKWSRAYVSSMLAGLVLLSHDEKEVKSKKRPNPARSSRKRHPPNKSTGLDKKFRHLNAVFEESHVIFAQEKIVERNKTHKTPSLCLQLSGQRMQDSVAYDPKTLLADDCAVCGHRSLM